MPAFSRYAGKKIVETKPPLHSDAVHESFVRYLWFKFRDGSYRKTSDPKKGLVTAEEHPNIWIYYSMEC